MVTVRGDLAAWLSREWLSSRNLHGAHLSESPSECDPHRAQLVTATGLTDGDDGDKLLWCELSDGDLWIDACISTTVVDQYNATTAIPFTASSRSKCLFALLSWRFVLARPPVPQRTSPSKRRAAASASAANEPKVELLSRRICLRVDAFKHHALGEGSLVNERMKPFRRTAPGANGANAVSKEDEERVMWVRRVEEAGAVQQKKEENKDEQVTYVTDLPADPALRLAPRASSSSTAAAAPPPPASALPSTHAPIARSDARLPPYVPHPSWPADDAPLVSAPSREDLQVCLRRAREQQLAKNGGAKASGADATSTAALLRNVAPVAGGSRSSPSMTTKEEAKLAWQPAPVDSAAMQACLAAAKAKAETRPPQGFEPATPAAPAHGRSAQPAPASAPSASFAAAFVAPGQDALRATLTAARDKARVAKQRASLATTAALSATSSPSSTSAQGRKRPRQSAPAEVGAWSCAAAVLAHKGSTAPAAAPSSAVLVAPNAPSVPFPRDTREDSILSQALDGDEHAQYAASTCPPSSPPLSSPQKSPAQRTASPAATLLPPPSSPHRTSPAPANSAHSSLPASSAQTVRARKHSRSPAPPPSSLPALPIFDEDDADSVTGLDEDGAGAMMHPAQEAARKTKGWPESAVKAFAPAPARPAATRPPAAAKRAAAPVQAQAGERAGKRVKVSQPQQQRADEEERMRVDECPTTTTLVPRRKPLIPLEVWDFDAWKRSRQDRRTTM